MSRPMRPLSRRLLYLEAPRQTQQQQQQQRYQAARTFTTTPTHSASKQPSTTYKSPDPASSPAFQTLKEIDAQTLTKTKTQVNHIINLASQLSSLTSQILSSAVQIQLSPGKIPPYKPKTWIYQQQIASSRFGLLHSHATRLHANLDDLESAPYPSDTPNSSPAAKFSSSLATQSQQDKINELRNLKLLQESTAHRVSLRLTGLEERLDAVRAEDYGLAVRKAVKRGESVEMMKKFKPAFKRVVAEGSVIVKEGDEGKTKVGRGTLAETVEKPTEGWGATATEKLEVGSVPAARTKNPFQSGREAPEPLQQQQQQPAEGNSVSTDGSGESNGTTTTSQPAFKRRMRTLSSRPLSSRPLRTRTHARNTTMTGKPSSSMQDIRAALERGLKMP
ncbi:hypothetical protein CERZMDRAFT_100373 [Cercospora zeae-maydis SCOH1-5]|uniref:Uncharacterized protein n=1 Tax=Cercospora zeae-maydis SCOH1-5 TaxID=717836 RepID=A0A6A6F556_9PEZI|nr:hypothetical protein CERZMDRAFT_100373 [Cercospora zeae-maydis SCOH1-5]